MKRSITDAVIESGLRSQTADATVRVAVNFIRKVREFAIEVCGCKRPHLRSEVKKSMLHAASGLRLSDFLQKTEMDPAVLQTFATAECPVVRPDRTMERVTETAPKRVIFASKRLRHFLTIPEAAACRTCSKRTRCKRFLAPPMGASASVTDLVKMITGLHSVCVLHKNDPSKKTFVYSAEEISSALEVLSNLSKFLSEYREFAIDKVPEATPAEKDKALVEEKKWKKVLREKREDSKRLQLPDWMRKTMDPADEEKRLPLFRRMALQRYRASLDRPAEGAPVEDQFAWVEVDEAKGGFGEKKGEAIEPLPFSSRPSPSGWESTGRKEEEGKGGPKETVTTPDGRVIELEPLDDIPRAQRFAYRQNDPGLVKRIVQFNAAYQEYISFFRKKEGMRRRNFVDVDDYVYREFLEREKGGNEKREREGAAWQTGEKEGKKTEQHHSAVSVVETESQKEGSRHPEEAKEKEKERDTVDFLPVPSGGWSVVDLLSLQQQQQRTRRQEAWREGGKGKSSAASCGESGREDEKGAQVSSQALLEYLHVTPVMLRGLQVIKRGQVEAEKYGGLSLVTAGDGSPLPGGVGVPVPFGGSLEGMREGLAGVEAELRKGGSGSSSSSGRGYGRRGGRWEQAEEGGEEGEGEGSLTGIRRTPFDSPDQSSGGVDQPGPLPGFKLLKGDVRRRHRAAPDRSVSVETEAFEGGRDDEAPTHAEGNGERWSPGFGESSMETERARGKNRSSRYGMLPSGEVPMVREIGGGVGKMAEGVERDEEGSTGEATFTEAQEEAEDLQLLQKAIQQRAWEERLVPETAAEKDEEAHRRMEAEAAWKEERVEGLPSIWGDREVQEEEEEEQREGMRSSETRPGQREREMLRMRDLNFTGGQGGASSIDEREGRGERLRGRRKKIKMSSLFNDDRAFERWQAAQVYREQSEGAAANDESTDGPVGMGVEEGKAVTGFQFPEYRQNAETETKRSIASETKQSIPTGVESEGPLTFPHTSSPRRVRLDASDIVGPTQPFSAGDREREALRPLREAGENVRSLQALATGGGRKMRGTGPVLGVSVDAEETSIPLKGPEKDSSLKELAQALKQKGNLDKGRMISESERDKSEKRFLFSHRIKFPKFFDSEEEVAEHLKKTEEQGGSSKQPRENRPTQRESRSGFEQPKLGDLRKFIKPVSPTPEKKTSTNARIVPVRHGKKIEDEETAEGSDKKAQRQSRRHKDKNLARKEQKEIWRQLREGEISHPLDPEAVSTSPPFFPSAVSSASGKEEEESLLEDEGVGIAGSQGGPFGVLSDLFGPGTGHVESNSRGAVSRSFVQRELDSSTAALDDLRAKHKRSAVLPGRKETALDSGPVKSSEGGSKTNEKERPEDIVAALFDKPYKDRHRQRPLFKR
uniref:Uncharacterized protein n=1 Tax=Chromera velia CCMP2878 TaxID=1169474 RepID=A0A0G4GHY6_9ALVE|eukprot:Cvel_21962.t1-p1 / transcript=Cvel_21962.t1 / gene=Cvel_21962 / organism=Chromera_velia_CCMP2878 / gene_product=hypothetical protein / transcript_product=hypothetical protein / location=Cvel_scaffold2110:14806-24796(+) / protein_length=1386 / sequence_SO=supercontig / SO=protein_coding / is_pseudo=false